MKKWRDGLRFPGAVLYRPVACPLKSLRTANRLDPHLSITHKLNHIHSLKTWKWSQFLLKPTLNKLNLVSNSLQNIAVSIRSTTVEKSQVVGQVCINFQGWSQSNWSTDEITVRGYGRAQRNKKTPEVSLKKTPHRKHCPETSPRIGRLKKLSLEWNTKEYDLFPSEDHLHKIGWPIFMNEGNMMSIKACTMISCKTQTRTAGLK